MSSSDEASVARPLRRHCAEPRACSGSLCISSGARRASAAHLSRHIAGNGRRTRLVLMRCSPSSSEGTARSGGYRSRRQTIASTNGISWNPSSAILEMVRPGAAEAQRTTELRGVREGSRQSTGARAIVSVRRQPATPSARFRLILTTSPRPHASAWATRRNAS
jgi:hypothetical protein